MKYEMFLGIFIFATFLIAVKVLSDIKSNRIIECIPLCYFVAILSALSAASGVARCVECYIFKSYSLIRFLGVILIIVSLQIWISIFFSRLKQNRDEEEFEIYDYEFRIIDGEKDTGSDRKEDLKKNFKRIK